MKLFGFNFERIKPTYENPISNSALSFVERNTEETAAVISASASFGTYVDLSGVIKTEAELITKYRDMLVQPEVENAVDEIINETICTDEDYIVKIDLDDLPLEDNSKEIISQEFEEILKLLDFKFHSYDIFKRWYVDGRLYYDVVIDNNNPMEGIKELRYIDPRKIREIKEVEKKKLETSVKNTNNIAEISTVKNEYYLYNEKGFGGTNKTSPSLQGSQAAGIRIAKDSIVHVPSGLTDVNGTMGLGYLHKCLPGDTRIKTPTPLGWKLLRDLKVGDKVYSYNYENDSLEETKITNKWNNGEKSLYKIRTKFSELFCTEDHPILVKNKETGEISYIEIKDIIKENYQICFINNLNVGEFKDISFIQNLKTKKFVYDIEVENSLHNFVANDMVVHNCIKILNQLRTIEDSLIIYRLARAPERRVWYVDVGELPKAKAEQYVHDIMISQKNRLIYDADSGCFAMDTKIPLLDGRTLTIEEISHEYKDKELWAYSCNPETGKMEPGLITWAGVTQESAKVMKITLDNNESFVCTPDHRFPTWNGLKRAYQLEVGESMIPLYRRNKQIGINSNEYEEFYKNDTKEWEFTHREVSNWKDEKNIENVWTYYEDYENKLKNTIHHKDLNRFNNSPSNLIKMNNRDHILYHANLVNELNDKKWNGPDGEKNKKELSNSQTIEYTDEIYSFLEESAKQDLSMEAVCEFVNENINKKEWCSLNKGKLTRLRNVSNLEFTYKDILRLVEEEGFDNWKSYRFSFNKILGKYNTYEEAATDLETSISAVRGRHSRYRRDKNISERGSKEWKEKLSKSSLGKVNFHKNWKITTPEGNEEYSENLTEYCREKNINRSNIKGVFGSHGYHAEELRNHKITSIEYLDKEIQVGTLTIDGKEEYHKYHTFALNSIYTFNSIKDDRKFMTMLEDYWLPRRADGSGTQVTNLPGGKTLGEIEDILYFQKQLYNSLNVPVARINPDAPFMLGRTQEISRDEIKFDKFINRLRHQFSLLFTRCLEKQVVLKGYMTIEEWDEIKKEIKYEYSRDNHFSELKDAEILANRLQTLALIQPYVGGYYSHKWIRRNILMQTDEDIERMTAEISQEMADPLYQMMQQQQMAIMNGGVDPQQELDQEQESSSNPPNRKEYDTSVKVDNAKHIIRALHDIKDKTPEEENKLRSAAVIISKNKK